MYDTMMRRIAAAKLAFRSVLSTVRITIVPKHVSEYTKLDGLTFDMKRVLPHFRANLTNAKSAARLSGAAATSIGTCAEFTCASDRTPATSAVGHLLKLATLNTICK